VREYPALARAIASEVDIPNWVLRIIEDVISGRKSAAKFWSEQKAGDLDEDVRDSNARHVHFIRILEEVLEILKSREVTGHAGPSKSSAERKLPDGDENSKVENAFASLDVGEPSKGFLEWQESQTAVAASAGSKKAAVKAAATYEHEINEEEVSFAVYCFFWDFNVVRKWLQKSWLLYQQGYLDFASVSTLTNTAFDMFRRAVWGISQSVSHQLSFFLS
jgi:hypothetical protein